MSEEEKIAIDYLIDNVVYWLDKGQDFVVLDIDENEKLHTILNLIDKQQEEIEKYKNKYEDLYDASVELYVSKDKIREKIKELENIIHILMPTTTPMERKIVFKNVGAIEVLQDLLEEN